MFNSKAVRLWLGVGLLMTSGTCLSAQNLADPAPPVNIILDSDMSHNADDVGDHATLWAMAANGEARVLALIISSTNDYSAACAQAIANYYGHPDVPIGANHSDLPNSYAAGSSYYTQGVAAAFGYPGKTKAQYPDAVTVYRQALARAANNSVYIVAGGYYKPLQDLLRSGPDSISNMTGVQLVAAKVNRLIPVGGRFPDSEDNEHGNLAIDSDSASYVVANWPAPIVWIPSDQFWNVVTGPAISANTASNPVLMAYDLYCWGGLYCDDTTSGWAQAGLIYAIRGGVVGNFGVGGQDGSTVVWDSTKSIPGRTIWSSHPNRSHAYLLAGVSGAELAAQINPLLQWKPPQSITLPPTANSQSVTVPGAATTITLTASDPQHAPLVYTVVGPPLHGTLTGTAPSLTYTPAAGYMGADSFTFVAGNGLYTSNTATVSITVIAANHTPVANPQSVTSYGTAVPIILTGSDPDNDPLVYTVVSQPAHGILSGGAPNVTYTPNSGYTGTDTFTFQANDGHSSSNVATVTITITTGVSAYSLRVNTGGSAITDSAGLVWQADTGYGSGYTFSTTSAITTTAGDARLYQTQRYDYSNLNYSFSNLPNGTYSVILHFAEIYDGCFYAGCRVFDVLVQGATFLHNFDVYATARAGNVGVARSTQASVVNGTLNIQLLAGATPYPTISAIEAVLQSPNSPSFGSISGFVTQSATGTPIAGAKVAYGTVSTISDNTGFYLLSRVSPGTYAVSASAPTYQASTQNATVVGGSTTTANFGLSVPAYAIRINAGGPALTDTANNLWQADTGYSGGYTFSTGAVITATSGDPRLYQTERYTSGPLQYQVNGLPSGTYAVKLYFAEIYSGCFYAGCRVFDIVVQGNTIWRNFDPYVAAGSGNVGVVRSTIATVTNGMLSVVLQAGYSQYPIVSAIEIIRQ